MSSWRRLPCLVGMLLGLTIMLAWPASASSARVQTGFAASTPIATETTTCCEATFTWTFVTLTTGPNPTLAQLHLNYSRTSGFFEPTATFTLADLRGAEMSGSATSTPSDFLVMVGTVSSGSGAYKGLIGHGAVLRLTLAPGDGTLVNGSLPPIPLVSGQVVDPATVVGTLTVS